MDPYASDRDLNSMVKGWFVDEMPDLDQRNEFLATYLIQNTTVVDRIFRYRRNSYGYASIPLQRIYG